MNGPGKTLLIVFGLVVALLGVWLLTSGDDDSGAPVSGPSWGERANAFCRDGTEEATTLTPPGTARQVAADADARIEILARVRDGIYTLGVPEGGDQALVAAYLEQLDADLGKLDAIAEAARDGGDYQSAAAELDESAGETAAALALSDCEALAQAVVRTP
ncbi:MAG: hypothetical protein U0R51_14030 [Solirubrobacterales bacterium]